MKALRIKLHQNVAHYRKEESIDNKMTYPLPPISTVVGALHAVCGYKEYHDMDVSIQGKYGSMQKKAFVDHCFLNSTQNDRGMLVKLRNPDILNAGYKPVASALKSQGNDFIKGITIDVHDFELIKEYRYLKEVEAKIKEEKKTVYQEKLDDFKEKKKLLKERKKNLDKKSEEYKKIQIEEKNLNAEEKAYKNAFKEYEEETYKKPLTYYATLQKSLKNYELLTELELVLHIKADEATMDDILENIYNWQSLGRSEDFVDIEEAKFVELIHDESNERESEGYSMYLDYKDVKNELVFTGELNGHSEAGTLYFFGKKYEIENGKRVFPDKKRIIYAGNIGVDDAEENVYLDHDVDDDNFG